MRVSTGKQFDSVKTQIEELNRYGCSKIFSDVGSGKSFERKGLAEALDYLREDDTLVVTRLDRLGRSTVDILRTVQELDNRGITIEALDTKLDTRTPAGRLVLSVLASMAEFERNLTVERTREGLAHARSQGRVGGRRPKLDKTQQQAVLAAIESGLSESQVAQSFGVSRSTITRIKRANRS